MEGGDKGRERDIADGARWRAGTTGRSAISGARTVRGGGTRGGSAISGARTVGGEQGAGARTVRGGGRGQGAGARYRVRGRCAVEGGGARYRVRGRCAVEGGDKGREREGDDRNRCRNSKIAGREKRILRTSILPVFSFSSPGFSGSRLDLVWGLGFGLLIGFRVYRVWGVGFRV